MHDDDHFEGLTFEPEEFAMRFAPVQDATPPKHSPVWAYCVENANNGIIFADTDEQAIDRLTEYYDSDRESVALFRIDDDQDIIEIK